MALPHTFTPGTPISASEVNANFADLDARAGGGLINDNGSFVSIGTESQIASAVVSLRGGTALGIEMTAANGAGIEMDHVAGSGSAYYGYYKYSSALVGYIVSSGGACSFTGVSDERLKHDIADAADAGAIIDGLRVREFKWNRNGAEQRFGFIAQGVAEVFPDAVSTACDEAGTMGVDAAALIPVLVKEMQSLRARVARIEDLIA